MSGVSLVWLALAFMDSGRVSDEFQPSLRARIRRDLLLLLAGGLGLLAVGAAVRLLVSPLVGLILLLLGAALGATAGVAWVAYGRNVGSR